MPRLRVATFGDAELRIEAATERVRDFASHYVGDAECRLTAAACKGRGSDFHPCAMHHRHLSPAPVLVARPHFATSPGQRN